MGDDTLLTPEDIFKSIDIETFDVGMPEWKTKDGHPGTIRLRMLTAQELAIYNDALDGTAKRNAMVLIVIRSAVQSDGVTPLFSERDLEKLKQKSVKAFARLQDEILRINGIDGRGKQAAKNA